MITALIAFLIFERIAKFTGIEPRFLVWIKRKIAKRNQPKVSQQVGVEVVEMKNKKAA
jgi:hypothetical protein